MEDKIMHLWKINKPSILIQWLKDKTENRSGKKDE